jgi:hypothetical protein
MLQQEPCLMGAPIAKPFANWYLVQGGVKHAMCHPLEHQS